MAALPEKPSAKHKDHAMTPIQASPEPAAGLMPEGRAILPSTARSALREAAAALNLAERHKQPLEMSLALAQMARCYRALQALGPAETCFERALAWARTLGAIDQAVEILCLAAETSCALAEAHADGDARRRHAAIERTRDRVLEITDLAGQVSDPQWEIKVLLRISDVLDRCGDHDDAVELQARAMRLIYGAHTAPEAAG
jgi:tetratricopeptide (TPR) repeat protein